MGLRFDLNLANWVAFVISDNDDPPDFVSPMFSPGADARNIAIDIFLRYLRENLLSSSSGEADFRSRIDTIREHLRYSSLNRESLDLIRDYFRDREWTALILPGGYGNTDLDRFLCSSSLLRTLVDAGSTEHGLLLQLEEPPKGSFSLTDVFPAFAHALNYRTEWPALLVWNKQRKSELFPLPNDSHAALERLLWILRHIGHDQLPLVRKSYFAAFGLPSHRPLTVIQLSDIHLGSNEANLRLPRLQQHVEDLVRIHASHSDVLLAVTGDLMDSPDDQHLDRVRSFFQFLNGFDLPTPIVVLGNHDVRERGFLRRQLQAAFELPMNAPTSGVRWLDELDLGFVLINSVVDGNLASGRVGERQLIDLANQVDRRRGRRKDFSLIAAIHHHPLPVELPEWYARPFYERILGSSFDRTEELEDAEAFLQFAREHRISAVLHGHKHIPRLSVDPKSSIPIIGCGSSVGKVHTSDGSSYLSVNILTINREQQRLAARLLASRATGGRLNEEGSHQAVLASAL